jgi:hypothetical protein
MDSNEDREPKEQFITQASPSGQSLAAFSGVPTETLALIEKALSA